jgi:hypothetical protein
MIWAMSFNTAKGAVDNAFHSLYLLWCELQTFVRQNFLKSAQPFIALATRTESH